jgi:predicted nucleotidyltransferase
MNKHDVQQIIQNIVQKLAESYRPQRMILFGSFVYGQPNSDSDIDLLIIKDTSAPPLERRIQVRQIVADPERRVPFSPLVITPEELERRISLGDPFYRDILTHGEVVYAQS